MFSFFRTRTGPAGFWDILVAKDAVPEAEKRFGRALMYRGGSDPGDMTYHEVGKLVAVVTEESAEFLLAHKDLTDDEQRRLALALELLFGQQVWEGGGEPTKGSYLHDRLKPWTSPPGVA